MLRSSERKSSRNMPTPAQIKALISLLAEAEQLPAEVLIRQCEAESSFRQEARSSCGAIGLFQLMPATAAELHVNPERWHENIYGGIRYLAQLVSRYAGDMEKALAAYNWGMGHVDRAIREHRESWHADLPDETKHYLRKILQGEQMKLALHKAAAIVALLVALLVPAIARAQTPPVPAPPDYFVQIGLEYNHYSDPAMLAATVKLGARMSTNFWSISTITMQPNTATIRSGIGYALKKTANLLLLSIGDAGITSQTTAVGALPIPSTVILGNIGGGFLVSYDLAGVWQKLKEKGLRFNAGVRMAAFTATSVQPAFSGGFSKSF
jgi:hypothetical protein